MNVQKEIIAIGASVLYMQRNQDFESKVAQIYQQLTGSVDEELNRIVLYLFQTTAKDYLFLINESYWKVVHDKQFRMTVTSPEENENLPILTISRNVLENIENQLLLIEQCTSGAVSLEDLDHLTVAIGAILYQAEAKSLDLIKLTHRVIYLVKRFNMEMSIQSYSNSIKLIRSGRLYFKDDGFYTLEVQEIEDHLVYTLIKSANDLFNAKTVPVELLNSEDSQDWDTGFFLPSVAAILYNNPSYSLSWPEVESELVRGLDLLDVSLPDTDPEELLTALPKETMVSLQARQFRLNISKDEPELRFSLIEISDYDGETIIVEEMLIELFRTDNNVDIPLSSTEKTPLTFNFEIQCVNSHAASKLYNFYSNKIECRLQKHDPTPDLIRRIEEAIVSKGLPACKIHNFGSTASNLAANDADIDLTITSDQKNHPLSKMWPLTKLLRSIGMKSVEPVVHARVPICKFYDPISRRHVDINFGHYLGVVNSALIRKYTEMDSRVKPLLLLVKAWAKARDLNNPSSGGTMSSYALCLMVLAYLINFKIVKNLQDPSLGFKTNIISVPGTFSNGADRLVDVSYDVDFEPKSPEGWSYPWNNINGVPALFMGFMKFYGYKFSFDGKTYISIKDNGFFRGKATNKPMIVKDPFDGDRNCTSMVSKKLTTIIDEFQRAAKLLHDSRTIDDLFKRVEAENSGKQTERRKSRGDFSPRGPNAIDIDTAKANGYKLRRKKTKETLDGESIVRSLEDLTLIPDQVVVADPKVNEPQSKKKSSKPTQFSGAEVPNSSSQGNRVVKNKKSNQIVELSFEAFDG